MQNAPSYNPSPEQRASELALRLLNDYKLCKLDSLNELTAIIRERDELQKDINLARAAYSNEDWGDSSFLSAHGMIRSCCETNTLIRDERDTLKRELEKVLGSPTLSVAAEVAKARNEEIETLKREVEETWKLANSKAEEAGMFRAERDSYRSNLEKEERQHLQTISQRDAAELAADTLTSILLNEEVDWSDHVSKWEEAQEAAVKLIDARNDAEQDLSQAYYLVTGVSPKWSNSFGNKEALQEIEDAINLLKSEIKERDSYREKADKQGLTLVTLCDMVLGENADDRSDEALVRATRGVLEKAEALDWLEQDGNLKRIWDGHINLKDWNKSTWDILAAINAARKEGGK